MKSVTITTAVLAIACAFGQGTKSANSQAMFAGMYKQAEMMFSTKNVQGLQSIMTPNYTETDMGRTMNGKESAAGLQQFLSMFKTLHCHFVMHSVKVSGNTAVTTDTGHMWGTSTMIDSKTKKPHRLTAQRDDTMTWTMVKGHWMVSKIVGSNDKMTMDGKPFNPMTMMPKKGK